MYRNQATQLQFENFYLPFGGRLRSDNRWVIMAKLIPWDDFETQYADALAGSGMGCPAKSVRIALGSLIIKERLGASDEETVAQIQENPYLQYFLGFHEYRDRPPFDPSLFVHFRKRLGAELVMAVNARIAQRAISQPSPSDVPASRDTTASPAEATDSGAPSGPRGEASELTSPASPDAAGNSPVEAASSSPSEGPEDDSAEALAPTEAEAVGAASTAPPSPANRGKLIMDATCAPADIAYPTDLNLLNEAREKAEQLIDRLHAPLKGQVTKPRTYRRQARKAYLSAAKARRLSAKKRRKAIGKQLRFVRRDLASIDWLLTHDAVSLLQLSPRHYRTLLIIHEVSRQQQRMFDQRCHRIEGRIVSLSQPHIRPIVRGKAGAPTEFGAKVSASLIAGYVFLDRIGWENFNESTRLPEQIEHYRTRFGCYPESVHADKIYRTRENRTYCHDRGIRLSGPPLGRPPKVTEENRAQHEAQQQIARHDERDRIAIEGKFGQGKRRFGLGRVMAKLVTTSECSIAVTFLVMNLEKVLRSLFSGLLPNLSERVFRALETRAVILVVLHAISKSIVSGRRTISGLPNMNLRATL